MHNILNGNSFVYLIFLSLEISQGRPARCFATSIALVNLYSLLTLVSNFITKKPERSMWEHTIFNSTNTQYTYDLNLMTSSLNQALSSSIWLSSDIPAYMIWCYVRSGANVKLQGESGIAHPESGSHWHTLPWNVGHVSESACLPCLFNIFSRFSMTFALKTLQERVWSDCYFI